MITISNITTCTIVQGSKKKNKFLEITKWVFKEGGGGEGYSGPLNKRELKQTRTATAVNKQLNFRVNNKPHTTDYILHIQSIFYD